MAVTSTTRYLLNWIKRLRRPFLLLVLVTIALFVMVPQTVLVDSDDDGIPDVPAIAVGATPIVDRSSSTGKDERPQNSQNAGTFASGAIEFYHLAIDRSNRVFHDETNSLLASLCLLRC